MELILISLALIGVASYILFKLFREKKDEKSGGGSGTNNNNTKRH